MKLNDLSPKYRLQAIQQLFPKVVRAAAPHQAADAQRPVEHESLAKKKVPRFDSPVRIRVHHKRRRLADFGNLQGKAVVDGIVDAGILQDDNPKWVIEEIHTQEKSDHDEVIITLERAES